MAAPNYEYIAKEPITFNGVLAYNPGDPVPADNVERHGWDDLVIKADKDVPDDAPEARSAGAASTPPAREDESVSNGPKTKGSGRGASAGK